MNAKQFRKIGLICGALCTLAGFALIIIELFSAKEDSDFLYIGIVSMVVGMLFVIVNLFQKDKNEKQ